MRYLYVVAGLICLALGAVGVALPILPTTPFLLVASICFVKGSDRFARWFRNTKLYQRHLEDFEKSRSMTLWSKIKILAIATPMLVFVIWRYDILPMRIALIALLVIKYYYMLVVVKTKHPKET